MNQENLLKRLEKLELRNKGVEADKAWEISWTRRTLLIIFTYIAIALYLNIAQIPNPWLNAIVPSIGFFLSTLTLPFFKNIWLKFYKK